MIEPADRLSALYTSLSGGPGTFALGFALATSHPERLEIVRRAVDWITQDHVQTRNLRQGRSEDELTIDVVSGLKYMGFKAWHDAQIGGHTDISIEGHETFLWVCEAKKHKGYEWLLEGFVQLSAYCPGIEGQDAGDVLIFNYGQDSASVMEAWIEYLKKALPNVVVQTGGDELNRYTTHKHSGSGRELSFRHKIVPLYWQKLGEAKAEAKVNVVS